MNTLTPAQQAQRQALLNQCLVVQNSLQNVPNTPLGIDPSTTLLVENLINSVTKASKNGNLWLDTVQYIYVYNKNYLYNSCYCQKNWNLYKGHCINTTNWNPYKEHYINKKIEIYSTRQIHYLYQGDINYAYCCAYQTLCSLELCGAHRHHYFCNVCIQHYWTF